MKRKILSFLILFPFVQIFAQQNYSIEEALKRNLVSIIINGAPKVEGQSEENRSSHYGDCLQAKIENRTNRDFTIIFETGRLLPCFDSTVQTMLLTKGGKVKMQPKQTKLLKLYAMCSQKEKRAPSEVKNFSIGEMANEKLVAIARLIEKKNYQNKTAQYAVWAISDNYNIDFMERGTLMEKEFFKFVLKINNQNNQATQTFKVQFDTEFAQPGMVSIKVFNNRGAVVKTIINDSPSRIGKNKYQYWLDNNELSKGKYKVVLFFNGVAHSYKDFEF